MKIVADEHIPFVKDYFSAYGELILKPGRSINKTDVRDADILLVRSITRVDEALLGKSSVKFVGSVTAGHDHLDTEWLDSANIVWRVAKGFNSQPVADYVVSVIAQLTRSQHLPFPAKAAVIGIGNIGQLVVERLALLGFDVILCDPLRAHAEPDFVSTSMNDIVDVDLITLHVPLICAGAYPTYHAINSKFLKRQKQNCILLNTSRGAVIDSQALITHGRHLKWCFDVWEHEPCINKTILAQTMIATPHIAGYSVQSKIRGVDLIYTALCNTELIRRSSGVLKSILMPPKTIEFSTTNLSWECIVLGIFDPLLLSEMLKKKLLDGIDDRNVGALFDGMRGEFNYRYEFGFCKVKKSVVAEKDLALVRKLGVVVA